MEKIILKIDGMMCGMCESHINDAIRKNFSVKKVSSSHKKGKTIIVSMEKLTEENLQKVIGETGYRLLSFQSEPYEKKKWFSKP